MVLKNDTGVRPTYSAGRKQDGFILLRQVLLFIRLPEDFLSIF